MNVLNRVHFKNPAPQSHPHAGAQSLAAILSAAMISAVTTFIASMQNYLYESTVASEGAWEAKIEQYTQATASALLENDAEIKTLGLVRDAGRGCDPLEGCQNVDKPYLYFMDFSEAILLPARGEPDRRAACRPAQMKWVSSRHNTPYNGGVDIQVGQTLTLDIGRPHPQRRRGALAKELL